MERHNKAVIGIGSNINPAANIVAAKKEINKLGNILKESDFIYTKPLLYTAQPDFLNGALLISTDLDLASLNEELKEIEVRLGREKTHNKNGPRTIDLDILIFNDVVTDSAIYQREFLRNSILELLPCFFKKSGEEHSRRV